MSQNLMTASREWSRRPDDQRYVSLESLRASVAARKQESWTVATPTNELRVLPKEDDLIVMVHDPVHGEERNLRPSNWSFNQLCQFSKAPASYLRGLPAELAAVNLQWGLEHSPQREDALVLGQSNGSDYLRAMTSDSYGRIWDIEVVDAVRNVNADGRWVVPSSSYTTTNPKRATTLYASDRDVFIFLVDPKNEIEVGGEKLFRGFYTWNSEVGAATFGLTTFLYRYVCDNRIIWGAQNIKELRVRHTSGAPKRFEYEGQQYLRRYADASTAATIAQVKKAQEKIIEPKGKQTVEDWLQARGFTKALAKASVETAKAEEGDARTVWQIVQGITAHARSIAHTNDRVEVETRAGKIMEEAVTS